ncbi:MAG: hypothetical protein JTJ15_06470 [Streptococcus sp.]|jgi:hypothetical protein|uniref:hypothetical protein n=1 Tax=Streptococcus salivarius TaxID=1304 RepID=UPI0012BD5C86|nr:hypothetical protein [Streptococcus salivarius]MBN2962101.1 hypothetical protein [Streptococcus sp.]MTQ99303.1 hypothetical protein [Streptococcus salivarius]
MTNNPIKAQILPATILLNKFIANEHDSNYELFLLEYLNQSPYFQKKSNFQRYEKPISENNSEPDAISPSYTIDFKLLAATTYLRGLRLASPSVSVPCEGVIAYGRPRKTGKEFRVGQIHNIFKELSLEELLMFRKKHNKLRSIDDTADILNVLTTVETNKNILLFFPYKLSLSQGIEIISPIETISKELEKFFLELLKYREKNTEFDTYLLTEYNDLFLLFSFKTDSIQYLECVKTKDIPTYIKLLNYSNQFK